MFRLYSMALAIMPLLAFLKPAVASLQALEFGAVRRILLSTTITGTLVATANMVALAWYPATTVLALMYTMPAFTSLLEIRRSGLWSLRSAAAPIAALFGVFMIASNGGALHGAGTVLVLVNALLWAIGTRAAGNASTLMPPQQIAALQIFIALICAVPLAIPDLLTGTLVRPSGMDLAGIAWAGLLNGALVFWLWYMAIARLGAIKAAWSTLLVPLLGSAIATVFFGETMSGPQRWGLALICTGILIHLTDKGRRGRTA